MSKQDTRGVALVLAELGLLLAISAVVDSPVLRVGLGLAVGLLLVQHALEARPAAGEPAVPGRRQDPDRVSRLLAYVRDFNATCHLVQSQQMSAADAMERIKKMEKELTGLLDEVVRASRGEGVPVPKDGGQA